MSNRGRTRVPFYLGVAVLAVVGSFIAFVGLQYAYWMIEVHGLPPDYQLRYGFYSTALLGGAFLYFLGLKHLVVDFRREHPARSAREP